MIMDTNKRARALTLICAGIVAFGLWRLGAGSGAEASREAQERMSMLWPALSALPVDDRVVIVKAAMTCNVHRLAPGAALSKVAACLRSGAREYDERHGDDRPISERLETLLRQAQENAKKARRSAGARSA